jgi:hypothetical protein
MDMIRIETRYLCGLILMVFAILPVMAQPDSSFSARIIETDPASETILYAREQVYIRVAYESNIPLRFQAAGYSGGAEIRKSAEMNPSPAYGPGSGEAVGWITYRDKTSIDEIRLDVFDQNWKMLDSLSIPLNMQWNGVVTETRREPAAWAKVLSAEQQNIVRSTHVSPGEDSAFWGVLIMLMGWSIPGYFILQVYMYRKYTEGWRKAALLPLWVMVPLVIYTLFALAAGSNLWPLMLLFITPFAFIYLLGVMLVKNHQKSTV